jgi:RimJ/RimL family protein N-acetyltransferase
MSKITRPEVSIRDVVDADLERFFEHQRDPEATRMAAFQSRERDEFLAHWAKVRRDETAVVRTVVAADQVAGNVVSWQDSGRRLVGYWIGREFWGRGIATRALTLFIQELPERPLYARVAAHNRGSVRVLEKGGFQRMPEGSIPSTGDGVEEFVFSLE